MNEWNQALAAALGVLPCGEQYEWIAERVRGLMHDESPRGMAERNINRTARWDNQTGRIVGVRMNPQRKDRLCYVVEDSFKRHSDMPVESVEVV